MCTCCIYLHDDDVIKEVSYRYSFNWFVIILYTYNNYFQSSSDSEVVSTCAVQTSGKIGSYHIVL